MYTKRNRRFRSLKELIELVSKLYDRIRSYHPEHEDQALIWITSGVVLLAATMIVATLTANTLTYTEHSVSWAVYATMAVLVLAAVFCILAGTACYKRSQRQQLGR